MAGRDELGIETTATTTNDNDDNGNNDDDDDGDDDDKYVSISARSLLAELRIHFGPILTSGAWSSCHSTLQSSLDNVGAPITPRRCSSGGWNQKKTGWNQSRATFCVRVQKAAVVEMTTGSSASGPMRSPLELLLLSGHIFYHMLQGLNGLKKHISILLVV